MLRIAIAFAAALASSTPQQSNIVPGTYDLEIVMGGGVVSGTLVLTEIRDSLAVKLNVGEHSPPISSITRKGAQLQLAGSAPGVKIVYDLTFSGATVKGTFEFNDQSGTLTGTRRK
jgi:hypothetical protein